MIKTKDSCYILVEQFSFGKFGRMLQTDVNRFLATFHGSLFKKEPSLRFGFIGLFDAFPADINRHEIAVSGRVEYGC